jgi:hypothetical protein
MKKVESIWAELSAKAQEVSQESTELSAEEVKLSMVQDADALYDQLVKGARSQVSILMKVESKLKELAGVATELNKMENKLESMAQELGVDLNLNYASETWVSDMNTYAERVGAIASVL